MLSLLVGSLGGESRIVSLLVRFRRPNTAFLEVSGLLAQRSLAIADL